VVASSGCYQFESSAIGLWLLLQIWWFLFQNCWRWVENVLKLGEIEMIVGFGRNWEVANSQALNLTHYL
jgi:hypothetical protein